MLLLRKIMCHLTNRTIQLENIVNKGQQYISLTNQLNEYNDVMSSNDEEMKDLIKDDISEIKLQIDSEAVYIICNKILFN